MTDWIRFSISGLIALSMVPAARTAQAEPATGLDRDGMNPAIRPQDDLFGAMNGKWVDQTPIPPDKAEYGVFNQLRDKSDEHVRTLIEQMAAPGTLPGDPTLAKVAAFYQAYMDTDGIDHQGLRGFNAYMRQIDATADPLKVAQWVGHAQGNFGSPFSLRIGADYKHPDRYVLTIWQGGLGMPSRDYYLKDDARFASARTAYRSYVQTLLRAVGDPDPAAGANEVFDFEKQLAQAHWEPEVNRDPDKTYNPTELKQLAQQSPGFAWDEFLKAARLEKVSTVVVGQPSYATAAARALGETPLPVLKRYLKVRMIDALADVLPKDFRDARFEYRGRALRGMEQDLPRWQRAVMGVDAALGEAVGQAYVEHYFPSDYKTRALGLVENLMAAYRESIDGLTWMTEATRQKAREKLAKYTLKIGYPDKWRDYSRLQILQSDPVGNELRAGRFEYEREAARVGQAVDRAEWEITPQTVNAYYEKTRNEIVFPAAILQPPFFDPRVDDATNYGAIGAVIGHEISHGFDDQGSKFDGDGVLHSWWGAQDRAAFDALTGKLVQQFSQYEPIPGHKVNGRLTLGENIADLSGLQIAFKAYRRSLGGKPAPVIDGLTGEQRFFLAWAQVWRGKTREARQIELLTIDPHSPRRFRANGAAVNHDAFHEAFATKPGDGMYVAPEERIRIW
ncbi:MAG TPA: M13 family metallopeptidase [Burkholderiaceae bacterium]|jgi:putative endopeptidase|nr:M13 family metallopeptidase [Burkholderiaceae bacterium]